MVRGGGQGVAFRARHRARIVGAHAGAYRKAKPPETRHPLICPALYKIHTFVCWLDRSDYKAYKALEGWVATLA